MSLSETIEEMKAPKPKKIVRICSLGKILRELDEKDRKALQSFLDDPEKGYRPIVVALRKNGYPISGTTITAHRNKECLCLFDE